MERPAAREVILRDVEEDDLDIFFIQQLDPVANRMAAFRSADPADRDAFQAKWSRVLSDNDVVKKTILVNGQVAGNVVSYVAPWSGQLEVGYWLGRDYWGQGIATEALAAFLACDRRRPLHARTAHDNVASLRVLEKCGFRIARHDRAFASARGEEIAECILVLAGNPDAAPETSSPSR